MFVKIISNKFYIISHIYKQIQVIKDVSYYLSNVELAEIAKVDPTVKVRRVPINIYTDIPDIHYPNFTF